MLVRRELLDAANEGNLAEVLRALSDTVNIEHRDEVGCTVHAGTAWVMIGGLDRLCMCSRRSLCVIIMCWHAYGKWDESA